MEYDGFVVVWLIIGSVAQFGKYVFEQGSGILPCKFTSNPVKPRG